MADTQITGVPEHASTPSPRRVSIEAEILVCGDTGRPELVIGDGWTYDAGTADELRAQITAARAHLDQMAALADHYEALTAGLAVA